MISLLFEGKYGDLKKTFCKFQLGERVNAILKKVGLYLQNDLYLISNSTLLNLLANNSLDIILSSDGMV